ncbi:MAG: hypothetical protein ABJ327_21365 [Litoreibacter sp.]
MRVDNDYSNDVRHTIPKPSRNVPSFAQSALRAVIPGFKRKPANALGSGGTVVDISRLEDRLVIQSTADDPDARETKRLSALALELADAAAWVELADYFIELEATRATLPSGTRAVEAVLAELREALSTGHLTPSDIRNDISYDIPAATLDMIELILKNNDENYMLAALLARLHLDCAWSMRGTEPWEKLDKVTLKLMRDHSNLIHDLVTVYDPIAYESPLLAEVQYSLAVFQRRDLSRVRVAFDDWIELDPGNPTLYRTHAFSLQSHYAHEDPNVVENEARRAMTLMETPSAQPYMTMYATALPMSEVHFSKVDHALFAQGFEDALSGQKTSSLRLVHLLADVVQCFPDEQSEQAHAAPRAAREMSGFVRSNLAPTVRTHLKTLYRSAWNHPEEDFLRAVAPAFAKELAEGSRVTLNDDGLGISNPN